MASPSASRTMGQATISAGKFRSRTMRRTIATCAASFCPKKAASGSTMWNSLATTVVTPRKCPGRERPSSLSLKPSTVTQVTAPAGYISSTDGANSNSTLSPCSSSRSRSNDLGYFARSSLAPNCVGLTKMEAATRSEDERAARTSERCPSWSAPIVGTNPRRFPAPRMARDSARISWMVLQIFKDRSCRCRRTSRRRHPLYRNMRTLKYPAHDSFVPADGNAILVGRLRAVFRGCHHPAIGPIRSGQGRQRRQQLARLQNDFRIIGDVKQRHPIWPDDEVGVAPGFHVVDVLDLRGIRCRDGL